MATRPDVEKIKEEIESDPEVEVFPTKNGLYPKSEVLDLCKYIHHLEHILSLSRGG